MEQANKMDTGRTGGPQIYKIFSIVEKPGNDKNLWLDIGVGRRNRDDSISCKLDCLPINGVIQIRPHDGRKNNFQKNSNPSQNERHEGAY